MFSDPSPQFRDSNNNLLSKIAQMLNVIRAPQVGDSDNVLLTKIVETLNAAGSGNFPAMHGDSDNNLLRKWAAIVSEV